MFALLLLFFYCVQTVQIQANISLASGPHPYGSSCSPCFDTLIFPASKKTRLLHRAFKSDFYAITVTLYKREFRWFFSLPQIL